MPASSHDESRRLVGDKVLFNVSPAKCEGHLIVGESLSATGVAAAEIGTMIAPRTRRMRNMRDADLPHDDIPALTAGRRLRPQIMSN